MGNLTGESIDRWESPWHDLMIWYGERPELKPPAGYIGWKGHLLSLVDPRFRLFLYDRAPAAIRVEEIVWGGVVVDGLPALVNPRRSTPKKRRICAIPKQSSASALTGIIARTRCVSLIRTRWPTTLWAASL